MDNSDLMSYESQIRRDRNFFIFLFSIIPINLAMSTMIGNTWHLMHTYEKEANPIGLFCEDFIIVLISILLEFVFYKLLKLKLGRSYLKLYNKCLIFFHFTLTFLILLIWAGL